MIRRILVLLIFTILCTRGVKAADFQADYNTNYAISPSGTTIVTHTITLTNKRSDVYPTTYTMTIDSTNITSVLASEEQGTKLLSPTISTFDQKTVITVPFQTKLVGIDKSLRFTIRYENGDIARKLGNIWEIHIPGVTNDPTLGEYTVSLQTPATFPPNAYLSPLPKSNQRWTKEQLLTGGISAAYGEYQSYIVTAVYELENASLTPAVQTIAIPPDTAYQTVTIQTLSPKSKELVKDSDGNWIASFELTGRQKLNVEAKLLVKTFIRPPRQKEEVLENPSIYLQSEPYWETNDPAIQELAKTYTTPRAIYDYVISTLGYKNTGTNPVRKGAIAALKNPKESVCTEFTDLFIAIARAAGIPAREVVGYAYTSDSRLRPLLVGSDILHAWPEYYDKEKKQWVPVDPTWGDTTGGVNYFDTFDFDHIAFVIHGASSEYPYPAGSFKQGTIPRKNVSVQFAEAKTVTTKNEFKTSFLLPSRITSGKPLTGSLQIENIAGKTAEEVIVEISASPPFAIAKTVQETDLPPFGSITIPLHLPASSYWYQGKGTVTVVLNGEPTTFTFFSRPMYELFGVVGLATILLCVLVWKLFRK